MEVIRKTKGIRRAAKISGLLAVICTFGAFLLRQPLLFIGFIGFALFLTVPVISGIISRSISTGTKTFWARCSETTEIILLGIFLTIVWAFVLSFTLPFIYTPPAITPVNLAVYNKCIEFMKNHNQYLGLGWSGLHHIRARGGTYMVPLFKEELKEETGLSEDVILEIKQMATQCDEIVCAKVQRDSNIVLFYISTNYILPDRPGVAHSLDGRNPNEIDSELLNRNKPFLKIGGNWYMSRWLVVRHWRNLNFPIPKSLIDHSLRTKGRNLDKNTGLQAAQSNINLDL